MLQRSAARAVVPADRLATSLSDVTEDKLSEMYADYAAPVVTHPPSAFHALFDPANKDVNRIFRHGLDALLFAQPSAHHAADGINSKPWLPPLL